MSSLGEEDRTVCLSPTQIPGGVVSLDLAIFSKYNIYFDPLEVMKHCLVYNGTYVLNVCPQTNRS